MFSMFNLMPAPLSNQLKITNNSKYYQSTFNERINTFLDITKEFKEE